MGRRRRLPRILLNAATVVSIVLFVVTLALWGMSYRWAWLWSPVVMHRPAVDPYPPPYVTALTLISVEGRVLCQWGLVDPRMRRYEVVLVGSELADTDLWRYVPYEPLTRSEVVGFAFGRGGGLWGVMLPYGALAVLTGLLPLLRGGRAYTRRQAHGSGLCPACGYDLRATPDRCPECGTAAAAAPSSGR